MRNLISNLDLVRELANDSLSRYSLTWQLQIDGKIHVTMEMDWNGFNNAAFKSIGKGSLKDYSNVNVIQLHPEHSSPITLQHQVYERNGYVFCKWFATNDTPSESMQFRINYDIQKSIQKGCTRAYCNDNFCTTQEKDGNVMQEYCTQSFYPETVNQFKIPVQNVSYNFTLPNENTYVPASLTFAEYQQDGSTGYKDECTWDRMDSTMYIQCDTLISDRTTSPQRPTFTWYVADSENVIPTCTIPCKKNNSMWIGIGVGAVTAWFVLIAVFYIWKRKSNSNTTQHESMQNFHETPIPSAPFQNENMSMDVLTMEQVQSLLPLVQHKTAYSNLSQIISRHNKSLSATDANYENATTPNIFACETCSICLHDFYGNDKVRLLPRCAHLFHPKCIDPWLTSQKNCCPSCNEIVLKKR
jgi:hypothetical protein